MSYKIKDVVLNNVRYGSHLVYTDKMGFQWALVLRTNLDNSDFYYDSPLWTNLDLLNETIFDLNDVSNSKYPGFNTLPITDKIMIEMNGIPLKLHGTDNIKGRTFLDLFKNTSETVSASSNEFTEIFRNYGSMLSPWNLARSSYPYTSVDIGINKIYNSSYKCRLGCRTDSSASLSSPLACEGLGLKSSTADTYCKNSGRSYTGSSVIDNCFYSCNLWIRLDIPSSQEKSDVSSMNIGDIIKCRYTSSLYAVGIFSELGTTETDEIPYAPSNVAIDGSFYFIKIGYNFDGKSKLVADRNIQTYIPWNNLNNVGICSLTGVEIFSIEDLNTKCFMRILSGPMSNPLVENEFSDILLDFELWNFTTASWCITTSGSGSSYRSAMWPYSRTTFLSQSTSSQVAYLGFRPVLLVDILNYAPIINVSLEKDYSYKENFKLSGEISDVENEKLSYKLTLGNEIIQNWTSPTEEIDLDISIISLTDNTLLLESKDEFGNISSKLFNLYKKDNDITYIDYGNPDKNFIEEITKISNIQTALIKVPLNTSMGYVLRSYLYLNVTEGDLGTLRIGLINSSWNSSTVMYNTAPSLSENTLVYTINAYGLNTIDITKLIKKLDGSNNFGIYVSTDNANIQLDLKNNRVEIEYEPTELIQPKIVYGDRCLIEWKSIVFYKKEAIKFIQLWRDTHEDFSSEIKVYESTNLNKTSFLDTGLAIGTYYYRIKIVFLQDTEDGIVHFDSSNNFDQEGIEDFNINGFVSLTLLEDVTTQDFGVDDYQITNDFEISGDTITLKNLLE